MSWVVALDQGDLGQNLSLLMKLTEWSWLWFSVASNSCGSCEWEENRITPCMLPRPLWRKDKVQIIISAREIILGGHPEILTKASRENQRLCHVNSLCLPTHHQRVVDPREGGNKSKILLPSIFSVCNHARNIVQCCTKSIPENRSTGPSLPVAVWDNVYLQTLVSLCGCHCPYCSGADCLRDIVRVFCLSRAPFCLTLLTISFLSFVLRFSLLSVSLSFLCGICI